MFVRVTPQSFARLTSAPPALQPEFNYSIDVVLENNHPAIIKRESGKSAGTTSPEMEQAYQKLQAMKQKFTRAKVKSGVLRGYFADMNWTPDEREQFINIIKSIKRAWRQPRSKKE